MIQKKTKVRTANLVMGVLLFTGLLCPCRGSSFFTISSSSVDLTCRESCATEKHGIPDETEGGPADCECEGGCCALFLIPNTEDSMGDHTGPRILWAVPAPHRIEIPVYLPASTSLLPHLLWASPVGIVPIFLELGSLLI